MSRGRPGCAPGSRPVRVAYEAGPTGYTLARELARRGVERCLRGAVIYRKLSLGSQSEHGEQRIARLPSAHTTCRLQHRNLHAYLIEVLGARARGDPVPLLA